MKKLIYLLIASLLFTACDLDRDPTAEIPQDGSITKVSDVEKYKNGTYALLRNALRPSSDMGFVGAEVQADLFHATSTFGNRYGIMHLWAHNAATYELTYQWQNSYSTIANINFVFDNLEKVEVKDADDQALLDEYLGQLHFLRAYVYSDLAERYAKDYRKANVDTDYGLPLVLTFNYNDRPERASLEKTYSQILADLKSAEEKLANYAGKPNSNEATIDAVYALKARVSLAMGNWSDASLYADKVISNTNFKLEDSEGALKGMWANDESSEFIFQLFADGGAEAANSITTFTGYSTGDKIYKPDYVPSQTVIDLYEDDDYRKNGYLLKETVRTAAGTDYKDIYLLNKYPFTKNYSASGNNHHMPVVFRLAELYLIKAEAYYNDEKKSDADVLAVLNELREARNASQLSGLSGEDLFNELKNERIRELIGEGFRLNDLKRWGQGINRGTAQNADILASGTVEFTAEANDNLFLWGIPANDIRTNPNLAGQQNAGY